MGWSNQGSHVAVGTQSGLTEVWDAAAMKLVRTLNGHAGRVSSLAWNGSILSTGSKDNTILSRDMRIRDRNSIVRTHTGHSQEVCGLKWSFDGTQLASGGNDNKVMIWNLHADKEQAIFHDHSAAVKAIAWNPNKTNMLASGGGTTDQSIRLWDTKTFKSTGVIKADSQVCNLVFSKTTNELVSTHGYTQNNINIWNYKTHEKIASLGGHKSRVLYLGMSPCGSQIVTGAGDETLRFWNVFPKISHGDSI